MKSADRQVLAFVILADGNMILKGSSIGRTYIALLPTNVTASNVELKITAFKAMPSFRLVAIPNPKDCVVAGRCLVTCIYEPVLANTSMKDFVSFQPAIQAVI